MTDLAASSDVAGEAGEARRPAAPSRRAPRRRLRYLVVLAVLAGAFCFLLVEGLGNSLNYYETVGQALAHRTTLGATTFRLEGVVLPHTVRSTARGTDFSVGEGRRSIAVHNVGSPPQLFRVGLPVIVVGHFSGQGRPVFESNRIMVKHSANYTPVPSRDRIPAPPSGRT